MEQLASLRCPESGCALALDAQGKSLRGLDRAYPLQHLGDSSYVNFLAAGTRGLQTNEQKQWRVGAGGSSRDFIRVAIQRIN